ncbi:hypothetical protein CDD83_2188 [Cordyceps sp. RAO-2017]|nr:hypothetical protein CDD83_2188 [Cordyceps sp. RAO-2017]
MKASTSIILFAVGLVAALPQGEDAPASNQPAPANQPNPATIGQSLLDKIEEFARNSEDPNAKQKMIDSLSECQPVRMSAMALTAAAIQCPTVNFYSVVEDGRGREAGEYIYMCRLR